MNEVMESYKEKQIYKMNVVQKESVRMGLAKADGTMRNSFRAIVPITIPIHLKEPRWLSRKSPFKLAHRQYWWNC
jgi:hypothetical protein